MQKNKTIFYAALTGLTLMTGLSSVAASQTLNLVCLGPLIFGEYFVTGSGAASIVVNPDGTRSTSGCVDSTGAPFSNGSCIVTQTPPFANIQITTPTSEILTRVSGSETMTVDDFDLVTNSGGDTFIMGLTPFQNVPFGADLDPGACGSIVSGQYEGSVIVTAIYQ